MGLLTRERKRHRGPMTVGADPGYNTKTFVREARALRVTPHVAEKKRYSAIDAPDTTDAPATTEATEPLATIAAAPEWVEVAKLEGNTNKIGEVFQLTGAPARMRHEVSESDFVMTAIYIMEDGTDFETDGGIPLVTVTEASTDQTRITHPPGAYYLHPLANNPYVVVVEEQR